MYEVRTYDYTGKQLSEVLCLTAKEAVARAYGYLLLQYSVSNVAHINRVGMRGVYIARYQDIELYGLVHLEQVLRDKFD